MRGLVDVGRRRSRLAIGAALEAPRIVREDHAFEQRAHHLYLEVVIPSFDGDPMERAVSTCLALIRACRDEESTPISFGDLKPQIESKFKGGHR